MSTDVFSLETGVPWELVSDVELDAILLVYGSVQKMQKKGTMGSALFPEHSPHGLATTTAEAEYKYQASSIAQFAVRAGMDSQGPAWLDARPRYSPGPVEMG